MKKIVAFGANSAIAEETLKIFATKGSELLLIGRNQQKLKELGADLSIRGALKVEFLEMDLGDSDSHQNLFDEINKIFPNYDTALIAYGVLPNQKDCQENFNSANDAININFLSPVSLLTRLANYFEGKGAGNIIVIGSVAGDRGRQSNYIYGAAKGGLATFCQGLRNRLYSSGVRLLLVKPGFVDTPMTAAFKKGVLFVKPEVVAKGIINALENDSDIVYLPCFWRYIMWVIRSIPESIFKRLKL